MPFANTSQTQAKHKHKHKHTLVCPDVCRARTRHKHGRAAVAEHGSTTNQRPSRTLRRCFVVAVPDVRMKDEFVGEADVVLTSLTEFTLDMLPE